MTASTSAKQPIDPLDQHILRALAKDAKTPYAEIAKQFGVSAATIHVRVEKMRQSGVIEGTKLKINERKRLRRMLLYRHYLEIRQRLRKSDRQTQ